MSRLENSISLRRQSSFFIPFCGAGKAWLDCRSESLYNDGVVTLHGSDSAIEVPRYTIPEGARYLQMAETTLKSWVAGRSYPTKKKGATWWENLIHRPDPQDSRLSFSNLTEAFVLQALRKQYRVK